ncbi:Uncharacterized protein TCM_012219 [Theobroma cacao]|uniref:Uncharacterized protein n=1 Tax=Theobroma cacao TaxID=3641 RepID=A0A061G1F6_THECC|nr:Uncharacterized protein TCM_012219 [Theobroma cacao]
MLGPRKKQKPACTQQDPENIYVGDILVADDRIPVHPQEHSGRTRGGRRGMERDTWKTAVGLCGAMMEIPRK